MKNKTMTLEQFADMINAADEWELGFDNLIKQNDWFADFEEKEEYKICQDEQELLYFDDYGKAQTRALREEEKTQAYCKKKNKLLEEMRAAVEQGKTKFLTKKDIQQLVGQKIKTIYFGYAGQDGVDEFVVGRIASEWELAEKEILDWGKFNGKSRAEYWASYMSEEKINEAKNTMMLLRADGSKTYIRCEPGEDTFYCSDIDRFVHYMIAE